MIEEEREKVIEEFLKEEKKSKRKTFFIGFTFAMVLLLLASLVGLEEPQDYTINKSEVYIKNCKCIEYTEDMIQLGNSKYDCGYALRNKEFTDFNTLCCTVKTCTLEKQNI